MATAEQAQAAISSFHDTEHPELAVSGKRCSVKVAEPAKRDVQARGRGGTGGGRDGGFARGPNFQPRDQGYRGPPRDQGYSDRRRSPPRASHGAPRDEGGYGQTPALQQQHSRDQGSYSQPDRGYPQQYDNRGGGGGGGGGGYQDRDDRNSERPRQYDAPAPANRDYGDRGYSSRGSAGPPQEPYSSRSAPREGGAGGYSQQDRPPPRDTGVGGGQSQFSRDDAQQGRRDYPPPERDRASYEAPQDRRPAFSDGRPSQDSRQPYSGGGGGDQGRDSRYEDRPQQYGAGPSAPRDDRGYSRDQNSAPAYGGQTGGYPSRDAARDAPRDPPRERGSGPGGYPQADNSRGMGDSRSYSDGPARDSRGDGGGYQRQAHDNRPQEYARHPQYLFDRACCLPMSLLHRLRELISGFCAQQCSAGRIP
jgi:hypothetical protein